MDLASFFNPESIAIIGVSRDPKKVGHLVARNLELQGYKGKTFYVNPKAKTIIGKKSYFSVEELPQRVDLALVALPAELTLSVLDELHSFGIKNVLVYAAGFKETAGGENIEQELKEKAIRYHMNLLGPNCIGYINTAASINTTFLKNKAPQGNIGFISQSGALGAVILDYFNGHRSLGFSQFISLGNKTVIGETEALEFLVKDSGTEVIALYLEDVQNGPEFRKTLEEAVKKKPVIVLKAGTTAAGAEAALSHTGGMAGDNVVFDAILHHAGAIRADTFNELVGLLKMYSFGRVPSSSKVLVLSNAGGVGVLLADRIVSQGLDLNTISEKTRHSLLKKFSGSKKITVHNPIDLLGDASAFEYEQAIDTTLKESDIGSVVVLLTPQANTEIMQTAQVLAHTQKFFHKPIYPVFMGGLSTASTHDFFEEKHMASFDTYELLPILVKKIVSQKFSSYGRPVSSLAKLSLLAEHDAIEQLLRSTPGQKFLNFQDSMKVIGLSGIETVPYQHMPHISHAPCVIKFPVVAKVEAPAISHKTEAGGVITHISDTRELVRSRSLLKRIKGSTGIYVQQEAKGLEIFLGAKRDPVFGAVVLVGIGGIYTELIRETVVLVHPLSFDEFKSVIDSRGIIRKYFNGFRNLPKVNLASLWQVCQTAGYLIESFNRIAEIDINPLFASPDGLAAADARIILR